MTIFQRIGGNLRKLPVLEIAEIVIKREVSLIGQDLLVPIVSCSCRVERLRKVSRQPKRRRLLRENLQEHVVRVSLPFRADPGEMEADLVLNLVQALESHDLLLSR